LLYLDSFNNIYNSYQDQTYHFIEDPNKDFSNVEKNKSTLNFKNKEFTDLGFSTGILAPYPINSGNFYNFTSLQYSPNVNEN
jgi:hypothetical protein